MNILKKATENTNKKELAEARNITPKQINRYKPIC